MDRHVIAHAIHLAALHGVHLTEQDVRFVEHRFFPPPDTDFSSLIIRFQPLATPVLENTTAAQRRQPNQPWYARYYRENRRR